MSARNNMSIRSAMSARSTMSARDATVSDQERESTRMVEPQITPLTSRRAEVEEIDLERDAEASRKTPEPVKESSPETEKTDSYQQYVMTGKGDTP